MKNSSRLFTFAMNSFKLNYLWLKHFLRLIIFFFGALCCSAASLDGTWASAAGSTPPSYIGVPMVLLERATGGRIIGSLPASRSSYITGGQRAGLNVTISFAGKDLSSVWNGTFVGTLSNNSTTLSGNYTDSLGANVNLTFKLSSSQYNIENWVLADGTATSIGSATRVLTTGIGFVGGEFVELFNSSFLGFRSKINSWNVAGSNHTITTSSSGFDATLTGAWGPIPFGGDGISGNYTTTIGGAGFFMGGKEGLSNTGDIRRVLTLLKNFADRIEIKSPLATSLFASTYLNDGKTKADWQSQLSGIYAAYNSLQVTVNEVQAINTYNNASVNVNVLAPPRVKWHLKILGTPIAGGPQTTVLDMVSSLDMVASGFEGELYAIAYQNTQYVFVGNGGQAFKIDAPILLSDAASPADHYNAWPYGVHGGGHPEGHPGIDFRYVDGTRNVLAVAAGTIESIEPNTGFPGHVNIYITHPNGIVSYKSQYDHINAGSLAPGITVGASVLAGQSLGNPGLFDNGPGNQSYWIHLGIHPGNTTVSPESYFNANGQSIVNAIWQTTAYDEELCEPFLTNPTNVSFPLSRTWTLSQGSGVASKIVFTRLAANIYDHNYSLLDANGVSFETGTISYNPRATSVPTIDLQPTGGAPARLGVYDIVSGTMNIDLAAPGAPRPTDLINAATYTTQ